MWGFKSIIFLLQRKENRRRRESFFVSAETEVAALSTELGPPYGTLNDVYFKELVHLHVWEGNPSTRMGSKGIKNFIQRSK